MNINFNEYDSESRASKQHRLIIELLEAANLITIEDGAKVVHLEEFKLGKLVVETKDGNSLYITRDISAFIRRVRDLKFDKLYYIVSDEQTFYFKQLFHILRIIGYSEQIDNTFHINYGLVTGMSSRLGNVKYLEDMLNVFTVSRYPKCFIRHPTRS